MHRVVVIEVDYSHGVEDLEGVDDRLLPFDSEKRVFTAHFGGAKR